MARSDEGLPGGSARTGWGGFTWRAGSQSRQFWGPCARKRSQCGQKYQYVLGDIDDLFLVGAYRSGPESPVLLSPGRNGP
jgi:hypothetical protein